jgi:hypothetical protein
MDQTVSPKSPSISLPFDFYTLRLFIMALVIFVAFSLLLPGKFLTVLNMSQWQFSCRSLASWRLPF